mmetsp:Transcript_15503/g.35727  ORF Transcript_15503/g.35727 Transcript_15503/m.35727 type:complete len:364 (+) Transcript_15503:194-1285(+)
MYSSPRFVALASFLSLHLAGTSEVSAWVQPIANQNALHHHAGTPLLSRSIVTAAGTILCSTLEDTTEAPLPEPAPSTTKQEKNEEPVLLCSVPLPALRYTVPGTKRGWKENGVWMDEDGPRNGPPQNFWRQMGDERLHEGDTQLVKDLLQLANFRKDDSLSSSSSSASSSASSSSSSSDATGIMDMMSGMAEKLERTNSIRIPSLNRLQLGDWAPIVRGGRVVATCDDNDDDDNDDETVSVPYLFRIRRTAEQRLAPKTPYGTFDEHLEPDEEVSVLELSGNNGEVVASGTARAAGEKHERRRVEGYLHPRDGELRLGGITYVTKYVLIMRETPKRGEDVGEELIKGPVTEIWMRVDNDDGSI